MAKEKNIYMLGVHLCGFDLFFIIVTVVIVRLTLQPMQIGLPLRMI
jgi:hypothetical protein